MRVLEITNLYPPEVLGGYELLAEDLARELRARGHEVHVLTTGHGRREAGVTRTLRLARPFGERARADRLRHLVAGAHNARAVRALVASRGRPDVALAMSLRRLGLAPLRALQELGIPCVVTVNDDWPVAYAPRQRQGPAGRLRDLVDRGLFAARSWRGISPRRVVYLSRAVRRSVLDAGVPLGPGTVRPQGVDLRQFSPRRYRPMRPTSTLLFAGRLHPSKGPEVAIDALAALRGSGVGYHLMVAGEADDPSYRRDLEGRASALGVQAAVAWLGRVARERMPELYRACDVLLFVSRLEHEGQGLTYLEAAACGLPVVAHPSGGAREFLERHRVARLARACTGEAFADEVRRLWADPAEQERLVCGALREVREHASLGAYAGAIERELFAALGEP